MNDYMTQVWRPPAVDEPQAAPLTGTPPIGAEPGPQPEPARRRLPLLIAILWTIVFISIHLAVAWTLLTAPDLVQEYCTSPLQPMAAVYAPLLLWGVTLMVWHWAQKGEES